MTASRPVVGVLCCNEVAKRPVQVVASRFIEPLATLAGATVLLVPAVAEAIDLTALGDILDGLLLTGSRSNVAADRYGGAESGRHGPRDVVRDEVALALAGRMIELGKPVFGICRGLQELNVLFGGTLSTDLEAQRHHRGSWDEDYEGMFDHRHEVMLSDGGYLHAAIGMPRMTVNSVHEQGIDRLGGGLSVEAVACDDGLIEAIHARPCGGDILAVQWHPEWDFRGSSASRAFFELFGAAIRGSRRPAALASVIAAAGAQKGSGWALRGH